MDDCSRRHEQGGVGRLGETWLIPAGVAGVRWRSSIQAQIGDLEVLEDVGGRVYCPNMR